MVNSTIFDDKFCGGTTTFTKFFNQFGQLNQKQQKDLKKTNAEIIKMQLKDLKETNTESNSDTTNSKNKKKYCESFCTVGKFQCKKRESEKQKATNILCLSKCIGEFLTLSNSNKSVSNNLIYFFCSVDLITLQIFSLEPPHR